MGSTVVMSLTAGETTVTLDPAPLYAQNINYVRQDEQGPAFRRMQISLHGFIEGNNSHDIREKYKAIIDVLSADRVTFLYTDTLSADVITIQNRKVYVDSFTEPEDWKNFNGEYEINLYYFAKITQDMDISASFGGYTFTRLPKWGRSFVPHRDSIRDETTNGTTANITLQGFLSANDSTELAALIAAMDAVFVPALSTNSFGTLVYGAFSHSAKVVGYECDPVVAETQAYFSIQLQYDIGDIVEMRASKSATRLNLTPVVKDQPGCGTRIVKLGNISGQFITYNISVTAADLETAWLHCATEAAARLIDGGIEWPGGTQDENENTATASVTIIKFYNLPVVPNLDGT